MNTLNTLVLGVGGSVSQGIITTIRLSKIPCRIIGACIASDSLGLYMCDKAFISPLASANDFIDWVANLCNEESVAMVFSGVEEIIYALETNRTAFEALTNAVFVSSSLPKLKIGGDKLLTAQWLKNNGLNYPLSVNYGDSLALNKLITKCGFPLICKPRRGKGAIGVIKLMLKKDLTLIPNKDYCIQQYLGDEKQEYTIGCYTDRKGILHELIIMRRELKHGTTIIAEIVENKAIKEECIKICNALKPKGPLNIQLRMHKGIPVCFELNVRFSGTTPIRARFGYNAVQAMIQEYLFNEEVDKLLKPFSKGRAHRYFNEFYMDLDMFERLNKDKEVEDVNSFNNYQESKL